jgi:hypothetical protein
VDSKGTQIDIKVNKQEQIILELWVKDSEQARHGTCELNQVVKTFKQRVEIF